jgi:GGDEF domain-containing protein
MAASDPTPRSDRLPPRAGDCLSPSALSERLEEEIDRAERYGTGLSCLLVVIDNLDQMAREHGGELREQTITYVAGALRRELRRYDRVGRVGADGADSGEGHDAGRDLLLVLPGADGPRGEIVARRALERLRTIKIEADGTRRPLEISVGLAAWRGDVSAEAMVGLARAAMRNINGDQTPTDPPSPESPGTYAGESPEPTTARIRAGGP